MLTVALMTQYYSYLADDEQLLLKLPTNFHEAQAVKATLVLYKETCSGLVVALLISLYLFLQVWFCMWSDPSHLPCCVPLIKHARDTMAAR